MLLAVHILIFLLLAIAAGLQLNDPDPVFWTALYILSAVCPLIYAFKVKVVYRWLVYGLASLLCVIAIVLSIAGGVEYLQHWNDVSLLHGMSPDRPYVEETRELIGTMIAFIAVIVYAILELRRKAGN